MIVALKTIGYLVSTLSVVLLGMAAWQSLPDDAFLRLCLLGGMAASIVGMLLRWISHLKDQREKDRLAGIGTPLAASPIASLATPTVGERPAQTRFNMAAPDDPHPAQAGSRGSPS